MAIRMASGRVIEPEQLRRLDGMLPQSPAARRLAKARAGADGLKRWEAIETKGGEAFYLKRLNWAEITRCHLESNRGNGVLDIQANADALRDFTLSALEACVYFEPNEESKYFTREMAVEWVDSLEPEIQGLVGELSAAILSTTPMLLPQRVEMRAKAARASQTESPLKPEPSEASSISTSTNGPIGSTPTPSSEPPATSPLGLASCPPTAEASPAL